MVPYERIVQWAAGPTAIVAGYLATQLELHVGLINELGLSSDSLAKAITASVTFAVGAGVTYAAHHKWLTNLAHWWTSGGSVPLPAVLTGAEVAPTPVADAPMPPPGFKLVPLDPDPAPEPPAPEPAPKLPTI